MKLPLVFPRESNKFRRVPDLPKRGESKKLETPKKSRSNLQIAAQGFKEKEGGGGERKRGVRAPPPPALYKVQLPGPDDPG